MPFSRSARIKRFALMGAAAGALASCASVPGANVAPGAPISQVEAQQGAQYHQQLLAEFGGEGDGALRVTGEPRETGADDGSVFARILRSGLPDTETNIVHRGVRCFAMLNAYPYATAHTLVLPYREVPDLEALDPAEAIELWATVTDTVRAIKAAYKPEGLNVGLNLGRPAGGSVSEHLHVHVVPRWTGDSNHDAWRTPDAAEALDATRQDIARRPATPSLC